MHQSENVMQCNCDSVPQTPFTRLTTQVEVPLSAACRSAAASFAPAGSWTTTAETCSWKGRAPNPLLLMLYDAIVYPRSLLQRAGQTFRKQWISRNDLLEISQYYKAPSQDFCNFTQFLCLFRLCHCRYFWGVTGLHRLHWLQECLLLSVLFALLFMIVLDLQPPAYLVKPWVNCGTSSLTIHGMIMFIDFHKFDTSYPPEQWHDHPIRRETTGPLWCHQAAEAA